MISPYSNIWICALLSPNAEKHFGKAIEGYTSAIALNPKSAVYFSNRAFAHIKMENYGAAVADASKALEQDPRYIKVRGMLDGLAANCLNSACLQATNAVNGSQFNHVFSTHWEGAVACIYSASTCITLQRCVTLELGKATWTIPQ